MSQDAIPTISVVVVTRDRFAEVKILLGVLVRLAVESEEIILVDNGSRDGTVDRIRREFPSVRIVGHRDNRGAPAGRNAGAAVARGEILVFLDDDAMVEEEDFFDRIRGVFQREQDAGVVAFRILDPRTRRSRSFEIPCRRKDRAEEPFETSYFIAAGCAIRKEVYERVDGMDETLIYGFEELDFGYRAVSRGVRIFYRPEIRILHGLSAAGRPSWRRTYYFFRNKIWVCARYLPWRMVLVQMTTWSGVFLLESIRIGRPDVFFKALGSGLRGVVTRRHLRRQDRLDRATLRRLKRIEGRLYF
jgi:GT2 family glycosyltransferase